MEPLAPSSGDSYNYTILAITLSALCWRTAVPHQSPSGVSVIFSLALFTVTIVEKLQCFCVWAICLCPHRYFVFYCPMDLVYCCAAMRPLRLLLSGMKEVTRTWKVLGGVTLAHSKYKDGLLVMIAIGWARGQWLFVYHGHLMPRPCDVRLWPVSGHDSRINTPIKTKLHKRLIWWTDYILHS